VFAFDAADFYSPKMRKMPKNEAIYILSSREKPFPG
jgi:hypothetical protein